MKYMYGNLITLAEKGYFDVIIHGCNCFHKMGAGIAKEIADRYPIAYEEDKKTNYGSPLKLGSYMYVNVESPIIKNHHFFIVNAYTQYYYGRGKNKQDLIHHYIQEVFEEIAYEFFGYRIGYPKIGAGLAGGDWEKISQIIDYELGSIDHKLVILN
ncbi:MAG: macro domain-containing protein [archaeon]